MFSNYLNSNISLLLLIIIIFIIIILQNPAKNNNNNNGVICQASHLCLFLWITNFSNQTSENQISLNNGN